MVSRGDWENEIAKKGLPYETERLQYKFNGIGLQPEEVAQIYMLNIKTKKSKQITDLSSSPSGLVYAKNGVLYFSASPNKNDADFWLNNFYRLEPNQSKPQALLKNPKIASSASPSPDDVNLVYVAPITSSFASPNGLFLMPSKGGKSKLLTAEYDIGSSPNGDSHYGSYSNRAKWLDNQTVLVNLNHRGRSSLAKIDIKTAQITILDQEKRAIAAFDNKNGSTVFIAETPQKPAELFLSKNGKEKRLSKLNDAFVRRYALANASEEIIIKKPKQADISYWKIETKNPRKDKALVLQVHGGPHTNYGYGFFHEFHMQAAAGYTVVYGNPRSSSSYGKDFALAALGKYGTVDADDVMAIAKHALKNHSSSKAPMHLTGGSYGGFMTNWLVGQNNFFASAVSQRSISNWLSFYGSSDIGYRFAATEVDGNPWDDTDKLWQQSPMKYVKKVKTPILLIHSEEDHRCPIEQAEQFYIAIKILNKADTKFIRYPNESHELSRSGRP
ncbi:MAG TPA: S9 family peptidase, partial [Trueperaceae bacterium]|nr:S9 family peptidase [Trueperaceae bacterium]